MKNLLKTFILYLFGAVPAFSLGATVNTDPFPSPTSKKGLQVENIEDALALGIKHAAINCSMAALIQPEAKPDSIRFTSSGREFTFDAKYLATLDQQIRPLSDADVVVYLILLNYVTADPAKHAILTHPGYDAGSFNKMSALNATTPEGIAWLKAASEMLAARYSTGENGRVWGWIVGNEVTSHWAWYNLGRAPVEEVASEYEKAVRIVHAGVRTASANARIYLSMDHHWTWSFDPKSPLMACGGKALLDNFAKFARERGDFDWHLAQHPYGENLKDPRFWNDLSATQNSNTPRISLKNIGVLTRYMGKSELLWQGKPRRIILSEQGFNMRDDWPSGELVQAAAFCAAWWKITQLDGIDCFILHRHIDHPLEGGLHLGLWEGKDNKASNPSRKRKMYEPFRLADTPQWEEAFKFALPIIGIGKWEELAEEKGSD